jgi:hypothetical protein
MQTVVETPAYLKAATHSGLTEAEREVIVGMIAENPTLGEEMVGTGGCRKVRVAGRGKGKSGGYRLITFHTGKHIPVFLLTVFSKGEKSTLTPRECGALHSVAKAIVATYRARR